MNKTGFCAIGSFPGREIQNMLRKVKMRLLRQFYLTSWAEKCLLNPFHRELNGPGIALMLAVDRCYE